MLVNCEMEFKTKYVIKNSFGRVDKGKMQLYKISIIKEGGF